MSCEVIIDNLGQGQGVEEAKKYGVSAVPAVVVEGKLLDCCKRAQVTKHDLEARALASRFKSDPQLAEGQGAVESRPTKRAVNMFPGESRCLQSGKGAPLARWGRTRVSAPSGVTWACVR